VKAIDGAALRNAAIRWQCRSPRQLNGEHAALALDKIAPEAVEGHHDAPAKKWTRK